MLQVLRPRIAEERFASIVRVKRERVIHGTAIGTEHHVLLATSDRERLAVQHHLRRTCRLSIIIQFRYSGIRIERISRRLNGELDTEIHVFDGRDDHAVRARYHIVAERIVNAERLIHFELDLFRRHFRGDSERLLVATGSTVIRPNCIQRANTLAFPFERIEHAERFGIEHTDSLATGSIQCPADHAGIRAGHDSIRLQALRFENACQRVIFGELHIRVVEHGLAIGKVPVVSKPVGILQDRSLDGIDIAIHGELVAICVIRPSCSRITALDLNLVLGIENVTGDIADFELDVRKRNIAFHGRNLEVGRSGFINTFRRGRIAEVERSRKLVLALVRVRKLHGHAIVAIFPIGV